jgi:hypothetical protein
MHEFDYHVFINVGKTLVSDDLYRILNYSYDNIKKNHLNYLYFQLEIYKIKKQELLLHYEIITVFNTKLLNKMRTFNDKFYFNNMNINSNTNTVIMTLCNDKPNGSLNEQVLLHNENKKRLELLENRALIIDHFIYITKIQINNMKFLE